jgi:AraC family transcriptional activator of pobA
VVVFLWVNLNLKGALRRTPNTFPSHPLLVSRVPHPPQKLNKSNPFTNFTPMKDIPLHQMQDRVSAGLEIWHIFPGEDDDDEVARLGTHRDDHYIFFLMENGESSLMNDFHEIILQPSSIYYVLPGQVHQRIDARQAEGWFIAADTSLIPPDYRDVFENQLLLQSPFMLDAGQLKQCHNLLSLIEEKHHNDAETPFNLPVTHSLLQAFLGIAAAGYSNLCGAENSLSRPAQLSRQFKKLLAANIHTLKRPSAYASALHVSEPYLNEALKKTTGLSVSYWIHNEVMLEAKRLLYYTQLTVKEIAHRLGYEDYAYFSRLFRKIAGTTPLEFRTGYRK